MSPYGQAQASRNMYLAVITGVRAQAVIMLLASNVSAILKLLRVHDSVICGL